MLRVIANVTIGDLVIDGLRHVAGAGSGSALSLEQSTNTISRLVVRDAVMEAGFRLLEHFSGSTPTVVFDGVRLVSAGTPGELMRITPSSAVDVTISRIVAESLSQTGLIEAKASTNVTVRGSSIQLPAGKVGVFTNGTPNALRVNSPEVSVDVTALARTNGDMALNSNTGVAGGAGPVVTDGTTWKPVGRPLASGTATLVGGTVAVANTAITASSLIRLTTLSPGGTVGTAYVASRTAGTGFTITSTSNADTSTVFWEIVQF